MLDPNKATHAELLEAYKAQILAELLRREAERDSRNWAKLARPEQKPPATDWSVWLYLAGRGSGKTRAGAEWVKGLAESGNFPRIALVAPTAADARDVLVEGESGILSLYAPGDDACPKYEPTKRRITWKNGTIATTYSADEPDRLRGPQHHAAWVDELAVYYDARELWDMLMLGLRLKKRGNEPKCIVTTTPKPIALIRELLSDPQTFVSRGTTYDNRANLAPSFFSKIIKKYEGTRLGRQELNAEMLDDSPDALWNLTRIDQLRVTGNAYEIAATMKRIVVAVDPATSSDEGANETGIVVVGRGHDMHGYVLADRSIRGTPEQWSAAVENAFLEFNADGIVAEKNQGGDMVRATIQSRNPALPVRLVHASRGKVARAEPISMLYEKGEFHHVGKFTTLEDQQCSMQTGGDYYGAGSPDHADALVWAATELFLNRECGSIQFLPEWSEKHHIVTTAELPHWCQRWIAVSLGPTSCILWFAQRHDRVHLVREKLIEDLSAEEVGAELARQTTNDLESTRNVIAWMDPKYFDSSLGAKSVSLQVQEGIERVLGMGTVFVYAHIASERHTSDPDLRSYHLEQRKSAAKNRRITLMPSDSEAVAAWEHFRTLLRVKPLVEVPPLEYDHRFAQHLRSQENGEHLYRQYLETVQADHKETLPKFVALSDCHHAVMRIPALVRDDVANGLPIDTGEAGAVAQALAIGMMAHRKAPPRESVEELVEKRVESLMKRRPEVGLDVVMQVESKAVADWKARNRQGQGWTFGRRRPRTSAA